MNSLALQIFGICLSAAATIIGSLVLFNLNNMSKRMDNIEAEQKIIRSHKTDCQKEFVSAEQFVRNESYNRQKLDDISNKVSQLAGSLKIVEQLPAIFGQIVEKMKG